MSRRLEQQAQECTMAVAQLVPVCTKLPLVVAQRMPVAHYRPHLALPAR